MKGWPSFLLLLMTTLLPGGCATTAPESAPASEDTLDLVWPKPPETARIQFVQSFSGPEQLDLQTSFLRRMRDALAGSDVLQMTRPYALSVDATRIAVSDPGAAVVHVFDTKRKTYEQLKQAGDHDFMSPIGVALADDRLFIADSLLNVVFVLNRKFKLLKVIDDFQRPTMLVFDPVRQRLYVTDTLAHEIRIFSRDGKALSRFGGRGENDAQFNYPSHLAFSGDRLFVNDTMNFRIQIFNPEGRHLGTFGKHGKGSGQLTQPKGLAVDSMGHVYIADAMSNRVQIFEQDGTFLLDFGQTGDKPGNFSLPAGLAIRDDLIYVADSFNHRIQVFKFLDGQD